MISDGAYEFVWSEIPDAFFQNSSDELCNDTLEVKTLTILYLFGCNTNEMCYNYIIKGIK